MLIIFFVHYNIARTVLEVSVLRKETKQYIKNKIKLWSKLIFNWRFLICFGIAWMITNGWSYVLLVCGMNFAIKWMYGLALAYITFIWLPITPEKIITVSIALFLVKVLFKRHNDELRQQILDASDVKPKD